MAKQYVKMADLFCEVRPKYVDHVVINEFVCGEESGSDWILEDAGYWMLTSKEQAEYAAHAINSHDELVAEVERLNALLECSREVIRFCNEDLDDDDATTFMRIWSNADWDALREAYPEADEIVYAADPTWRGWPIN